MHPLLQIFYQVTSATKESKGWNCSDKTTKMRNTPASQQYLGLKKVLVKRGFTVWPVAHTLCSALSSVWPTAHSCISNMTCMHQKSSPASSIVCLHSHPASSSKPSHLTPIIYCYLFSQPALSLAWWLPDAWWHVWQLWSKNTWHLLSKLAN